MVEQAINVPKATDIAAVSKALKKPAPDAPKPGFVGLGAGKSVAPAQGFHVMGEAGPGTQQTFTAFPSTREGGEAQSSGFTTLSTTIAHDDVEAANAGLAINNGGTDSKSDTRAAITETKVFPAMGDIATQASDTAREAEIDRLFKEQHFVRTAPRFDDLVGDETRTGTLRYLDSPEAFFPSEYPDIDHNQVKIISEHDALVQLRSFLGTAQTELGAIGTERAEEKIDEAKNLDTNLVYIPEKELEEAVAGIATRWRSYLREDPAHKIYVPVHPTVFGKNYPSDIQKSGGYLFGRVASHISEEDGSSRISTDFSDIQEGDPKAKKVVILDDWSKSGTQVANAYEYVQGELGELSSVTDVEVNLVAASSEQIGDPIFNERGEIPLFAYYDAGPDMCNEYMRARKIWGGPLVAGTHSTPDFDVGTEILFILKEMNDTHPEQPISTPAVANIIRPYAIAPQ